MTKGNRLLLCLAVALASAALASATASPAETASGFSLGRVGHPETGVVTVKVSAYSGGVFTASGKLIRTARAGGKEAGAFTLKLRLTKLGLEKLSRARGRQLRIEVEFTLAPNAGEPSATRKKLIFRVVERKG